MNHSGRLETQADFANSREAMVRRSQPEVSAYERSRFDTVK
jgi:hypothetical protein